MRSDKRTTMSRRCYSPRMRSWALYVVYVWVGRWVDRVRARGCMGGSRQGPYICVGTCLIIVKHGESWSKWQVQAAGPRAYEQESNMVARHMSMVQRNTRVRACVPSEPTRPGGNVHPCACVIA